MSNSQSTGRRIHFIANCVYSNHLAGGDIHFFNMAEAAVSAGYVLHFFGGTALSEHVKTSGLPAEFTLTDRKPINLTKVESIGEQVRLFANYLSRFWRTLRQLRKIESQDLAYAVTDYWVDTLPVLFSRARQKVMILGMDAPTFKQIVQRSRPDVTPNRLSSIYYWASQNLSLRLFRFCRDKRVLYVHPSMRSRLLKMGFKEEEIAFVSNGMNMKIADQVPPQKKDYDAMWIGRLHFQKGIDDLLETIGYLKSTIPGFRVVLVGKLEKDLKPKTDALGLSDCVTYAGLVSEEEKFRLFKASRVFLMPSRYESWGIVIAEALVCGTPVVAYDLDAYRPIFNDLVDYVPCFDRERFKEASKNQVMKARAGEDYLKGRDAATFRRESSWEAGGQRFVAALRSFGFARGEQPVSCAP